MSKKYFLSILLVSIHHLLIAQSCKNFVKYLEKMQEANSNILSGDYRLANDNYNAALVYCQDSSTVIYEAKDRLFDEIEQLRIEAVEAKEMAQKALAKSNKLINAFYFYENRFALAFKEGRFYYIDKSGNKVEKLQEWRMAEQFDKLGFAKVSLKKAEFLMDTLGKTYRIAHDLDELGSNTKVLIYRNKNRLQPIGKIFDLQRLVLLKLDGSYVNQIPKEIGDLKTLKHLSLKKCELGSLPNELEKLRQLNSLHLTENEIRHLNPIVGSLTTLRILDLSYNILQSLPSEIGQLDKLEELHLNENNLNELPTSFTKLKRLKVLGLAATSMSSFPTQILELSELIMLDLSHNSFLIPEEISRLSNLQELFLRGYSATEVQRVQSLLPNCKVHLR